MKINILLIIFLIVLTGAFDTVNQLLLKSSINTLDWHVNSIKKVFNFIKQLLLMPKVWLGFCFCCVSVSIWLFVLSKADLNFAFSTDSMHYIFIAFASKIFLKEKVGFWRWIGTGSIAIGIILLAISNSG